MRKLIILMILLFCFLPPCWAALPTFDESQEFSQWLNDIKYWEDIKNFLYTCELNNQIEGMHNPDQLFHNKIGNETDFCWFISYAWLRGLAPYKTYISITPEHTYAVIEKSPKNYIAVKSVKVLDVMLIYTLSADGLTSQLEEVTTTVIKPTPASVKKRNSSPKNYCTIDGVCY